MLRGDIIQVQAEAALKRIAGACRSSIDDVLDILSHLPQRTKPGSCMICFFSLYRKLPSHCQADLQRVKAWLEREIEVVATDSASNIVESFPCRIAEQEREIEEFCRRVMEETRSQLKPGTDPLRLQFRFSPRKTEEVAV